MAVAAAVAAPPATVSAAGTEAPAINVTDSRTRPRRERRTRRPIAKPPTRERPIVPIVRPFSPNLRANFGSRTQPARRSARRPAPVVARVACDRGQVVASTRDVSAHPRRRLDRPLLGPAAAVPRPAGARGRPPGPQRETGRLRHAHGRRRGCVRARRCGGRDRERGGAADRDAGNDHGDRRRCALVGRARRARRRGRPRRPGRARRAQRGSGTTRGRMRDRLHEGGAPRRARARGRGQRGGAAP